MSHLRGLSGTLFGTGRRAISEEPHHPATIELCWRGACEKTKRRCLLLERLVASPNGRTHGTGQCSQLMFSPDGLPLSRCQMVWLRYLPVGPFTCHFRSAGCAQ